MSYNASDERQVGRARKRERERQRLIDEGIRYTMATPHGRAFIADLIYTRCDLEGVYLAKDAGIHTHQGRRMVGRELRDDIERVAPRGLSALLQERQDNAEIDRALQHESEEESDAA